MSQQTKVSHFEPTHVSLRAYVIGFLYCLTLTLVAYFVTVNDGISNKAAVSIIAGLAIVQCCVQLRSFLHLGHEFKPRWKLLMFMSMLIILSIIVIGSLWIMENLNYRMIHSPEQMKEYVESQNSL